jgi:glycosyltransferase involved in cell wall biosynthesis
MAQSHLHIITSIAEDNTTVVFEAMSHGVPTFTIEHCGMGDVICDKCGIKVPLDDYDVMIKTMAATLSDLLATPQILVDLAHTTLQCAEQHTWDKRLVSLNNMYKKAITLHGNRSGHSVIEGVLSA